jgi:hypothetical protein
VKREKRSSGGGAATPGRPTAAENVLGKTKLGVVKEGVCVRRMKRGEVNGVCVCVYVFYKRRKKGS